MGNPPSKKISSFLQSSRQGLRPIFTKINLLAQLDLALDSVLDPPIRKYCQAANLSNGCLVLLVANASVTTQLRYQKINLLAELRKKEPCKSIKDIEIKVRPFFLQPLRSTRLQKRTMPRLSAKTAQAIKDCAAEIKDPKLQAIMRKIAQHTE